MIKSFFYNKKWRLWSWGGLSVLIISLWIQVSLTVAINTWYGGFYDLLQNAGDYKDNPLDGISIFYAKLISVQYTLNGFEGDISFAEIVFPYIFVAIFTGWFTRIYGLKWREAITPLTINIVPLYVLLFLLHSLGENVLFSRCG